MLLLLLEIEKRKGKEVWLLVRGIVIWRLKNGNTHRRCTKLSEQEKKLLDACLPELKKNIEKGKKFVQQS